jgi:HSP20 family protein
MLPILRTSNMLPNIVDDFFGKDFLTNFFEPQTGVSVPAVNIVENKDDFRIEVAAPGLDKDDFKVEMENNVLSISSEKEKKNEVNDENYMRREFSYSSFCRTFTMPDSVDADKIKASHRNGILEIVIPKREEAKQKPKKQIKIN